MRADPTTLDELLDEAMTTRSLEVEREDEVFVKGVAQASDGLCCVFSRGGGQLILVAAKDRAADLDRLLSDLELELKSQREKP